MCILEFVLYCGGLGLVVGVDEVGCGVCVGLLVVVVCVFGFGWIVSFVVFDDLKKFSE